MLKSQAAACKKELSLQQRLESVFLFHPGFGLFLSCVAMPIIILSAVALCVCPIALLLSLMLGWL